MSLEKAVEEKKFDVRMVEKNIQRGVITAEDLKAKLDALADDKANALDMDLTTPDPANPNAKGPEIRE